MDERATGPMEAYCVERGRDEVCEGTPQFHTIVYHREQIRLFAREIDDRIALLEQDNTKLQAENERLRSALVDFRDHGVRHDLHPTIDGSVDTGERIPAGYLQSIDSGVRGTARAALERAREGG